MRNCLKCGKIAQVLLHPHLGPGEKQQGKGSSGEEVQIASCLDPACGWSSEPGHKVDTCDYCVSPAAQKTAQENFRLELEQLKKELADLRAQAALPAPAPAPEPIPEVEP